MVAEFAAVCKSYGCFEVSCDDYSGGFVKELFRAQGVAYRKSIRTKSEIFLDLLPIVNSCNCELLDDARLFQQLCGLERIVARAGREAVCKGAGHKDDLANSSAGALCLAALAAPPLSFTMPFVAERERSMDVRSMPLIPPVISGGLSNPILASGPEYEAGGDWLAGYRGWPLRPRPAAPAPAPAPAPAAPMPKHMTVSPDWNFRVMTMTCGPLKWTRHEEQTLAGFKHRIEQDMKLAHGADVVISWPSELKEKELSRA